MASATDRIAATWYSGSSFNIALNITDTQLHQVALYLVDWDFNGRVQTVEVIEPGTNTILDTRTVSGFTGGQYLVWNIQGSVVFRVTKAGGTNGVFSGLFVDPPE